MGQKSKTKRKESIQLKDVGVNIQPAEGYGNTAKITVTRQGIEISIPVVKPESPERTEVDQIRKDLNKWNISMLKWYKSFYEVLEPILFGLSGFIMLFLSIMMLVLKEAAGSDWFEAMIFGLGMFLFYYHKIRLCE